MGDAAASHTHPSNTWIGGLQEDAYALAVGVRSTELKQAKISALHWRAYTQAQDRPDSAAMRRGRLVHMRLLEPERYAAEVVVSPAFGDMRSAANRKERDAWLATLAPGACIVGQAEADEVAQMADAALARRHIRALLYGLRAEQSVFWQDDDTGVFCKARLDAINEEGMVIDIKTSRFVSHADYARDFVARDYGLSAAHYLAGAAKAGGVDTSEMLHLVIENAAPYDVVVHRITEAVLPRGEGWRRVALRNIARAQKENVYPGVSDEFLVLEEPRWAPLPPATEG